MMSCFADDHALLAEGIASMLRPRYDVVGIVIDGRQMLAEADRLKPDLITLDIGMPGLNGLEAAKQVRKLLPRAKLVFVTQQVDLRYLQAALQAGANGFVAKQSSGSELLTAVEQVTAGRRYITPLLEEAFAALDPARRSAEDQEPGEPLTARQREVLQLIAEGHTNKSIAKQLNISTKTIEFLRMP
jgi:DNA-binding NarL/FixJ family response regulator